MQDNIKKHTAKNEFWRYVESQQKKNVLLRIEKIKTKTRQNGYTI
jgi:hypothetical protein